jgi:fatty-acyl-CoA synthase
VNETKPAEMGASVESASKSWLRALELTASIPRNPERLLNDVIAEMAAQYGEAPALLSDRERFSYGELSRRANRYAQWALEKGLVKGDVVALLMSNRPEYFAIWLGVSSVGAVVALVNTNLTGPSLAHCINIVNPKHLIVGGELVEALTSALEGLSVSPEIWVRGPHDSGFQNIDEEVARQPEERPSRAKPPKITIEDRALYIYTSGTTGLPKAANVSHARVLQWSFWFAGMMGAQHSDRMYNCLPMYHSIGGVLVPGAMLVAGGSVVIREKFSASQFWSDIARWDCTMFQYVGEFCRYLLHAPPPSQQAVHRVRLACGNGLAADVWDAFKETFRIPRIFEFYAATEGGVALFNAEGKSGAIGRVPAYLAHRFAPALVRFDVEKNEPVRNEDGFCVRAAANEPGEAIARITRDPANIGARYEGYTDGQATDKKILQNVFERGDAWFRTGDLMRKDDKGYFYFVDRIGDTFRWKGENVATSEVAEAICAFPGVKHAIVYGVEIPRASGRAGMASLVAEEDLDFAALRAHLAVRLPSYARPLFLRLRGEIEVTGTFKYSRTELVREGFNPENVSDAIYLDHPASESYRRIDSELFEQIQSGQIRL